MGEAAGLERREEVLVAAAKIERREMVVGVAPSIQEEAVEVVFEKPSSALMMVATTLVVAVVRMEVGVAATTAIRHAGVRVILKSWSVCTWETRFEILQDHPRRSRSRCSHQSRPCPRVDSAHPRVRHHRLTYRRQKQ